MMHVDVVLPITSQCQGDVIVQCLSTVNAASSYHVLRTVLSNCMGIAQTAVQVKTWHHGRWPNKREQWSNL